MAFIFGGSSAKNRPAVASLQFQTSAQGGVIPLLYGTQRVAGNLLNYADFASHTGAGGGGIKTSKTAGASTANTFYTVSYIAGFCQGEIVGTGDFWWDKSAADGLPAISTSNNGADGQAGDAYWQSAHPDTFLNYSGTSNLTIDNGNLGKASTLPNLSVEIFGILAESGVNSSDADPSAVIIDFLANPRYGAGFPGANLDVPGLTTGLSSLFAYCAAAGIFLSPSFDTQQTALTTLGTFAGLCNSEIVWSGNLLKIVPRGDHTLSTQYQQIGTSGVGAGSTVSVFLTNPLWGTITATYTLTGAEVTASITGGGLADAINAISQLSSNGILAGCASGGLQIMMQGSVAQATTFAVGSTGGASCTLETGTGPFTFVPNIQAIYSLGDDDFIAQESSVGLGIGPASGGANLRSGGSPITGMITDDPVIVTRTSPADALNYVVLQCKNRGNSYNDQIVEAFDQAAIDLYGIRKDTSLQAAWVADPLMVGTIVAQLTLQRQLLYRNTYTFKLGWRFCLLEPMDLVQITDARLGLNALTVRITGVQEDDEGMLTITAEDFFGAYDPFVLYPGVGVVPPPPNPTVLGIGGGTASLSPKQSARNYTVNAASDPGDVNQPLIFEPPATLTGGALEVWVALSGSPNWGGADVWFSSDDGGFDTIGTINGSAIHGTLSAGLAPDVTHTLSVDLAMSRGQMTSVSPATAANLLTLCYVDGEFIAFETATLTGPHQYDLTTLYRNAYGAPSGHAAGTPFARLDQRIGRFPYPQTLVGKTVYFKFVSFNMLQGGLQDISLLPSYRFTTTGSSQGE